MDLRHGDLREGVAEPLEVFIEVAVGAHVDQHHLEVAVLLGQDQRQPLLDESVVLREHRHHDRHRGLRLAHRGPAVVAVGGHGTVDEEVVAELHEPHRQEQGDERRTLPAVVRQ